MKKNETANSPALLLQHEGRNFSADNQIITGENKLNAKIDRVTSEIESKVAQLYSCDVPSKIGILSIKSANTTLIEAAKRPNPNALWMAFWYDGEVCVLFSDSNLGKSIYATQIATHIAKSQRVLYFDFELSDKQFQLRYTSEQGSLYQFPENLYRVEIDRDSLDVSNFEDSIINSIEEAALTTKAKVLIIDNLTYLCIASEKGDAAGNLMLRLTGLKKKYDLSILVLAHTPKRPLINPITQNDLAGSKKLYNFFDSGFAIGKSAQDSGLRYIKQVKVRHGEYTYDSDNVIVASIDKDGSFLHFVHVGYAAEKEHLKEPNEKDTEGRKAKAIELKTQGLSNRAIAKDLKVSEGAVRKWLKS